MAYDGQLNTNKVFASLFNMIISLQVFSAGITDLGGIYESRKVDGTLFGDTKLYISTDALKSYPWDGTDTPGGYNLLTIKRPPAPVEEAITIDTYRQIPVTVDEYLTKQAFLDEGSFGSFNGVILSWLQTTKQVYEHTTYTANMIVSAQAKATSLGAIALAAPANVAGYDLIKWRAQELYRQIEDFMKELNEPARTYNDHGFLRNYKLEDFDIVVPLGILSSVNKHDIPFLFTPDDKPMFKEIHWKYFGVIDATGGTTDADGTPAVIRRSLVEMDYTVAEVTTHVFPGDLIPDGAVFAANVAYTPTYSARPNLSAAITAILMIHKEDYPIMSAFTVGTSFFNARRLDINHYLTFGHNNVYAAHLGERALLKINTTV
jgi:hypothetical protein